MKSKEQAVGIKGIAGAPLATNRTNDSCTAVFTLNG